jgi:hypothetical protein
MRGDLTANAKRKQYVASNTPRTDEHLNDRHLEAVLATPFRTTAIRVVTLEILCVVILWWVGRVFGA